MNPLRKDPTRTTTLRNQFLADMKRRFKAFRNAIWNLIVVEDAFGLSQHDNLPEGSESKTALAFNTRFAFDTDQKKVENFQSWMQEQIDEGILEIDGDDPWTSEYVGSAYKKGVTRSYTDSKPGLSEQAGFTQGTKEEFLRESFGGPVGRRQLELLGTRAFEQLKGVTAEMSAKMTTHLVNGFAQGKNPREIAREMTKGISGLEKKRALTIARTEIVHAYAEGQLDSFDRLGVEELTLMAEWSTAGDDLVCPKCLPLEGTVLKVSEARGLIPRHPNCRCAWIPANIGEDTKGQKRGQEARDAVDRSVNAERKKGTLAEKKKVSTWPGADTNIAGTKSRLIREQRQKETKKSTKKKTPTKKKSTKKKISDKQREVDQEKQKLEDLKKQNEETSKKLEEVKKRTAEKQKQLDELKKPKKAAKKTTKKKTTKKKATSKKSTKKKSPAKKKATKKATKKTEKRASQKGNVKVQNVDSQTGKVVDEVLDSVDNKYPGIRDVVENQHKEEVTVARNVTDVLEDLKGKRPRGWPEGSSWENCGGCHRTNYDGGNQTVVGRKVIDRRTGKLVNNNRYPATLSHEYGHAVDDVYGQVHGTRLSQTDAFKDAYAKDLAAIEKLPPVQREQAKAVLDYYLGSNTGAAGRSEVVAEGFRSLVAPGNIGSNINPQQLKIFRENFPNCIKEIDKAATQLAKKGAKL